MRVVSCDICLHFCAEKNHDFGFSVTYSLLWRNFRPRGPFLRELSLLLQYKESRAHTSLFSASLLWIWLFFYKITFFSSLRFSWHVPFQLNDVVRAMSPLPSHSLHTGFLTTIRLLCQNPVQTACITTVRNTCRYDFFGRLICHMKYFCGGYYYIFSFVDKKSSQLRL